MTKYDFLGDLNRLLQSLPEDERRAAMQYYEDYFADAGEKNEQKVIEELGTPEMVAASIMGEPEGDVPGKNEVINPASVQESGKGQGENAGQESGAGWQGGAQWQDGTGQSDGSSRQTISQWISDTWKKLTDNPPLLVLVCIAAVICIPVVFSVAGAVLSAIFGVLMAIFGIILGFWIGGAVTAVVGVVLVVTGIIRLISAPAMGVLMMGGGLISFAVGAALFMAATYLATRTLPFVFREISSFCQKQFGTAGA